MKNQKGITLIALIITIIVMLILVAVTINVALNGGLFTKAHDSALKTEKQSVYEQTVAAMVLDDNGDFDVNETGTAAKKHFDNNGLSAEWNYTSGTNSGTLTVHGKRGTYKIAISADGIGQPKSETQTTNSFAKELENALKASGKGYSDYALKETISEITGMNYENIQVTPKTNLQGVSYFEYEKDGVYYEIFDGWKVQEKEQTVNTDDTGDDIEDDTPVVQNGSTLNFADYMNGETLPTFTLHSSITEKDYKNIPTTNSDGKGPHKITFSLVNNSETWDIEVNSYRFSMFVGDDATYRYYWDAAKSATGQAGWEYRANSSSDWVHLTDNFPTFTGYHIEVDSDEVATYSSTADYFADLTTWYGDVFVTVE